jgi:hypothetical protein
VEPIGPFIESLNLGLVIEVAEEAERRARSWLSKSGRKKGTAFPAFDMFVVTGDCSAVDLLGGAVAKSILPGSVTPLP